MIDKHKTLPKPSSALEVKEQGLALARHGLRIFWVNAETKKDPSYRWSELASSQINHVIEDYYAAVAKFGEDNVAAAWACGLDGYVALDLDVPEAPDWWMAITEHAAVNFTNKGHHLVCKFPEGMRPGNALSNFPTRGWGECRGYGGYIIVAGLDRFGLTVSQLENALPFPRPEYLTEYTEPSDATAEDVKDLAKLLDGHRIASPESLRGIRTLCDPDEWDHNRDGDPRNGRHGRILGVATQIAEEALQGLYPYHTATQLLKDWTTKIKPEAIGKELNDCYRDGLKKALANLDYSSFEEWKSALREYEIEAVAKANEIDTVDLTPYLDGTHQPIAPTLAALDDGRCLLYRDRLNMIWGPSGSGKSWMAALVVAQEIADGRDVLWLEFEDTPQPLVERLLQMGADRNDIGGHLHVVVWHDDQMLDDATLKRVLTLIETKSIEHVFVDSLGEAFATEGIDENSDADVSKWFNWVAHAIIARSAAGVTLIDHTVKSGENQLFPSGSKRKRASFTGAGWLVAGGDPFTKTKNGFVEVTCGKDRHGNYARGSVVARLVLDWGPEGCEVELRATETMLGGPVSEDDIAIDSYIDADGEIVEITDTDRWKWRRLLAVGRRIGQPMSVSQWAVEFNKGAPGSGGRTAKVAKATIVGMLESLHRQGLAIETSGARNARLFEVLREGDIRLHRQDDGIGLDD